MYFLKFLLGRIIWFLYEKNYAVKYFEKCMYKMDMLHYMVPIEPYNIYLNELSLKSSFTKLSEFLLCVPSCIVSVCRE